MSYNPDAVLADPNSRPIHRMYAEINIGIRDRGEHWSKCLECGEPFQIFDSSYFCDDVCESHYTTSLRQ